MPIMNLDKESVQDNSSQHKNKRILSNKFEPNNGYAMTISFIRARNTNIIKEGCTLVARMAYWHNDTSTQSQSERGMRRRQ